MRALEQWSERFLGVIAAIVLFAMMTLTFVDVFGRKFLNKPVYGAYEITELLMGVLIFSALPIVTARQGHVTIDVLDQLVPRSARAAQHVIVTLLSAIVLAFIAWRLWLLGIDHGNSNEVTMTLYIPHSPFAHAFGVLAGLSAVACFLNAFRPRASGDTVENVT